MDSDESCHTSEVLVTMREDDLLVRKSLYVEIGRQLPSHGLQFVSCKSYCWLR
jgi:hypothetical protein